jgi:hypothetical protein
MVSWEEEEDKKVKEDEKLGCTYSRCPNTKLNLLVFMSN